MNLHAVRDEPRLGSSIPRCEGKEVTGTSVTLTSMANLDIDNAVVGLDDVVRFVGEGRVVGVSHIVNEKTGQLVRVQRIKVIEVAVAPWDENDPDDDGIVREVP